MLGWACISVFKQLLRLFWACISARTVLSFDLRFNNSFVIPPKYKIPTSSARGQIFFLLLCSLLKLPELKKFLPWTLWLTINICFDIESRSTIAGTWYVHSYSSKMKINLIFLTTVYGYWSPNLMNRIFDWVFCFPWFQLTGPQSSIIPISNELPIWLFQHGLIECLVVVHFYLLIWTAIVIETFVENQVFHKWFFS